MSHLQGLRPLAMGSLGTAESKLLAVRLLNDARHFAVAEARVSVLEGFMGASRNLQKQEDQHEIVDEVCTAMG